MPKEFNWQWDRMEEHRLEQTAQLDDGDEPEDEDAMMEMLRQANERTVDHG